ncbi:DUF397 domain-containing protein [Streptomyces boncukensis]|uniref:DUF397 domain-containing protein n=1 Tax=Streptomyces boncukensis TaxID=2711219 RepID=A0A6G4WZ16_9ACTN|nr:DUF397 domain-containing protein [Streptomyces boncukensis]NGO70536.1 DUF397 domain-containing protein [Streptomyces boncukensis]
MTPRNAPPPANDEFDGAYWHTSSYSGQNNNCVERGILADGRQAVRDTKDPARREALLFEAPAWSRFLSAVRDGWICGNAM